MTQPTIAFIGAGNMAASLIGGLVAAGHPAEALWAADPLPNQLEQLRSQFGINITQDNTAAIAAADVLVLAVKPQILRDVLAPLSSAILARNPLLISIAAGVRSGDIGNWIGGDVKLVRTMPNTPSLLQAGATGLLANTQVDADDRDVAEHIMRAVGATVWVEDEAQLDAVTAISGSGPAYFFLFIEALRDAGKALGLDTDAADLLATQTAYGASRMALESAEDVTTLRQKVTSPGGTTERAIATFEAEGLRTLVHNAAAAASKRSAELADTLAGK